MRTLGTQSATFAAMLAATCFWIAPARSATKSEKLRAAAKIVEETLQREAHEGVPDRAEALKAALEQAPNYQPAMWHSGYLFDARRKDWLRYDDVLDASRRDKTLAAYRQFRVKCPETVEGRVQLARWCEKRGLDDQARAHWMEVLWMKPDHEEAMRGSGMTTVFGMWFTQEEIAEAEAAGRKASAALAKWRPRLEKLRDRLASNNERQREKAREEILGIGDPDAAGAIDAVLCQDRAEMAAIGIEWFKQVRVPQSAIALAWHAVSSPWEPIRQAAAAALRTQDKEAFVPFLLGQIKTPAQTGWQFLQSPPVRLTTLAYRTIAPFSRPNAVAGEPKWRYKSSPGPWEHTFHLPDGSTISARHPKIVNERGKRVSTVEILETVPRTTPGLLIGPSDAEIEIYRRQTEIMRYYQEAAERNARVSSALAGATGQTQRASPDQWWDWWREMNEVFSPTAKPFTPPLGAEAEDRPPQSGDCLAIGTTVWTELGLTPVEQVAAGDRVFSCDPETGCLVLKPVLRRIERPAGDLLAIRAGGQAIQTSGGHTFWVAGQGWVKARDLRQGAHLHTLRGTVPVEETASGSREKSYQLVVAGFHTYFAGKPAVLTHDNTFRRPTDRVVPGLAAEAAETE